MTGRTKNVNTRIEVEIERNREESNWTKVIELAGQLKERSPDYGNFFIKPIQILNYNTAFVVCLSDFLIGEGKLESFLEEWPPIEANQNRAKIGVIDAKRYLNLVTNEAGVKVNVLKLCEKS